MFSVFKSGRAARRDDRTVSLNVKARHAVRSAVTAVIESLEQRQMLSIYTVTSTGDTHVDGQMTLREAIEAANANAGADSINFDSTVFADSQTITLDSANSELEFTDSATTTIQGTGSDELNVKSGGLTRVFTVDAGAKAELYDMTISGGRADKGGGILNDGTLSIYSSVIDHNTAISFSTDNGGAGADGGQDGNGGFSGGIGGGIYTSGTLVLGSTTLSNNIAQGGDGGGGGEGDAFAGTGGGGGAGMGGGIYINAGTVQINFSTLSTNYAVGGMGGSSGSNSGGHTPSTGGGGGGGGLAGGTGSSGSGDGEAGGFASGGGGGEGTDVGGKGGFGGGGGSDADGGFGGGGGSRNAGGFGASDGGGRADGGDGAGMGGGLFLFDGTLTVLDSTIDGNSATGATSSPGGGDGAGLGGGAFLYGGTSSFTSTTIAENKAPAAGSSTSYGGGVFEYGGSHTFANTLIANNTAANSVDVYGAFVSTGGNLIADDSGSTGFSNAQGDQLNVGPDIGTLGNNGGPTQTVALLQGSLAIDKGVNANLPVDLDSDQRGVGFDRIIDSTVDVGAFEYGVVPVVTISDGSVTEGNAGDTTLSFAVNLDQATTNHVRVYFHTEDGTAIAGPDYVDTNHYVDIDPTQTSGTIQVLIHGDTTFEPDETFKLVIDSITNGTSGNPSGFATGTILNDDLPSGPVKVPSDLKAKAISSTQVQLNWKDKSNNETGFEVEYSKTYNFTSPTTVPVPGGANVTTYTVPGLSASTYYYFRVRATGSPDSAYTKSVKIKTQALPKLAKPTSFAAKAIAGPNVKLTWADKASGEIGYEIEVSTVSTFATLVHDLSIYTPNLNTFTVNGLSKSTYYYFRVRAISLTPALDSDWSSSLKVKTLSA